MNVTISEDILKWEFWYTGLLFLHIVAGSIILATFWIPLVSKKGSVLHILTGRTFLSALVVVLICGAILAVMRMYDPISPPQSLAQTVFFLFICIFTGSAAWHAIRVYKLVKPEDAKAVSYERVVNVAIALFGLFSMVLGIMAKSWLFTLFPLIGIGLAISHWYYWITWPHPIFKDRMLEHMTSMISCVIATLTAFSVIALSDLLDLSGDSPILWWGPTVIFVPLILYWRNKIHNMPS